MGNGEWGIGSIIIDSFEIIRDKGFVNMSHAGNFLRKI